MMKNCICVVVIMGIAMLSSCISNNESATEKRIKDSIAAADQAMMDAIQNQNPVAEENSENVTTATNNDYSAAQEAVQQIADVQLRHDGQWLYVVDGEGHDISSMVMQGKDFIGYSSDFFVVVHGDWLYTYDANCREIASMVIQYKTPLGVSGSTFKVKHDQWIYTYDKYCKELSSRVDN